MSQQDMGERAARTNKIGRKAGSELLQRIVFMVAVAVVVFIIVSIGLYFLNYYWFSKERTDIGVIVQPALGIVAGIGAVAYLVIAYRKQKNAEDGIIDQRMVTAIDQLASESPQKRIAGVYALAEISDTYKGEYKQRVVDILCGYLRTDRHGKYTQEIIDYVENRVSKLRKLDNEDVDSKIEETSQRIMSPDAPVESTIFRVMHERLLKNRPELGDEYKDIQIKETDQLWCDCRFDLRDAVFVEQIDFSKAYFEKTINFQHACFVQVVDFSRVQANSDINFDSAKLGAFYMVWARFLPTDFCTVFFGGAYAVEASFGWSHLDHVCFDKACFGTASFEGMTSRWATFGETKFHCANFKGSHIESASFEEAVINEARFNGAQIITVDFVKTKFKYACFFSMNSDQANFEESTIGEATFIAADYGTANFLKTNFGEIDFGEARFGKVSFNKARFMTNPTDNFVWYDSYLFDEEHSNYIVFESREIPEAFENYLNEDEKDYAINPARWPEEKD